MFHGRHEIGQRVLGGVDLAIDFATLGEYGLEPYSADESRRQRADRRPERSRRPGWEARAVISRGACGTAPDRTAQKHLGERIRIDWRFPSFELRAVDLRAAIRRYSD